MEAEREYKGKILELKVSIRGLDGPDDYPLDLVGLCESLETLTLVGMRKVSSGVC